MIYQALADGRPYDIEYRIRPRGGDVRFLREVGEFIADPDGTLRRAVGTIQDITDRKRRELELESAHARTSQLAHDLERSRRKLLQARERFDLAVSGTNDGIWDWLIDKNELYLSPVWFRILGYAPNEIAVQFRDELISKKFPPESGFEATYHLVIRDRVPAPLYLVVERPDLYS